MSDDGKLGAFITDVIRGSVADVDGQLQRGIRFIGRDINNYNDNKK